MESIEIKSKRNIRRKRYQKRNKEMTKTLVREILVLLYQKLQLVALSSNGVASKRYLLINPITLLLLIPTVRAIIVYG
jgi:hypothetical protein